MGDAETLAERADCRRFGGALPAQAVVDSRRCEPGRRMDPTRPPGRHRQQGGRIGAAGNSEQRRLEFLQRRKQRVDRRRGEPRLAAQQWSFCISRSADFLIGGAAVG
jgi:hypothetical protein